MRAFCRDGLAPADRPLRVKNFILYLLILLIIHSAQQESVNLLKNAYELLVNELLDAERAGLPTISGFLDSAERHVFIRPGRE